MGKSVTWGKSETKEFVTSLFPSNAEVLDIGPGSGTYHKLFKGCNYILDGVEIFEPYIEQFNLRTLYRTIWNEDVIEFVPSQNYDVIIMGDILEHLSVEDAQRVIKRFQNYCKLLVIQVPFKFPQSAINKNPAERHKQKDLTEELFNERYPGFTTLALSYATNRKFQHGVFYWQRNETALKNYNN